MNRIVKPRTLLLMQMLLLGFLTTSLITSTGCMGVMTQLLYVIKGHKVPAKYSEFKGKKIAVVCVSDASAYGPDTLTYTVCKGVSMKLTNSVKDVKVIPPYKIEEWIDENGGNVTDFEQIGKDLGADMVLAIELASYSIKEGQTIFKGRADFTATVFDINNSSQVTYVVGPEQFTFPENGRPAIQTTDRQFEMIYLTKLTERIAREFYPHDEMDNYADDASLMNF